MLDIENRHVDTEREGEGKTNWKSSINVYTLPRVKQIDGGKPLYRARSSGESGRVAPKGGNMCTLIAGSCCTAETSTDL